MTTERDLFLSDIHVENPPIRVNTDRSTFTTEIHLIVPSLADAKITNADGIHMQPCVDEDGDLIAKRPVKYKFKLEHCMTTTLDLVGLQLWTGGFYLCDYLLHNSDSFAGFECLDLGSGLGLTTMISSLFAKRVYSTDLASVLDQAQANFVLNKHVLDEMVSRHWSGQSALVTFDQLDWSNYADDKRLCNEFGNVNLIIASDVVYDEQLTLDLLNCLFRLMANNKTAQPKYAFVSTERRINFDADQMVECSTCYDLFERSMLELNHYAHVDTMIGFQTELVDPNDFSKYLINYQRNPHLKLWKIKSFNLP
jgi:predicted nicotinamide N-methyase